MQKALIQMNLQLSQALSDVMGRDRPGDHPRDCRWRAIPAAVGSISGSGLQEKRRRDRTGINGDLAGRASICVETISGVV